VLIVVFHATVLTVLYAAIYASASDVPGVFLRVCLPQRDNVCDTCARKSQQPRVRTAVDRIVEEHEIPVADNVGDLHVFLDEHEDVVLRTLVDAVNRRR
jgi:hypothetical protein